MSNYPPSDIPVEGRPRPVSYGLQYAEDSRAGWYPYSIGTPGQIIAGYRDITGEGPHSVDTVSQMVCPNVPTIVGHVYTVRFIGSVSINVLAGRWDGNLRADGSNLGRAFSTANATAVTIGAGLTDSAAIYVADESAEVDFDLFLDEVVDGSTITLGANANIPRWLLIYDSGVIPEEFMFGTW